MDFFVAVFGNINSLVSFQPEWMAQENGHRNGQREKREQKRNCSPHKILHAENGAGCCCVCAGPIRFREVRNAWKLIAHPSIFILYSLHKTMTLFFLSVSHSIVSVSHNLNWLPLFWTEFLRRCSPTRSQSYIWRTNFSCVILYLHHARVKCGVLRTENLYINFYRLDWGHLFELHMLHKMW